MEHGEIGGKVTEESTTQLVDSTNLPFDSVKSLDRSQQPCDTDESVQRDIKMEMPGGPQPVFDKTIVVENTDADDTSASGRDLDDTVMDHSGYQLHETSNNVDLKPMPADSPGTEFRVEDRIQAADSDSDKQQVSGHVPDSSIVQMAEQIEVTSAVTCEEETTEMPGGCGSASILPGDAVDTASDGIGGGLLSVDGKDLVSCADHSEVEQIHAGDSIASTVETDTVGVDVTNDDTATVDAEVVAGIDEDVGASAGDALDESLHQPCSRPGLSLGESEVSTGLLEHRSEDASDKVAASGLEADLLAGSSPEYHATDLAESLTVVCDETRREDHVSADEERAPSSGDAVQLEHVESEEAASVSSTGDDVLVTDLNSYSSVHDSAIVESSTNKDAVVDVVDSVEPSDFLSSSSNEAVFSEFDSKTAEHLEHTDVDDGKPAGDKAADDSVVAGGGGGVLAELDRKPSISNDTSGGDMAQDSLVTAEKAPVASGADDSGVTADWLDNVVDVSNVSFVSRDDIPGEGCSDSDRESAEGAVTAVNSGGVGIETDAETSHETVSAVDTESTDAQSGVVGSKTAVETSSETEVVADTGNDQVDGVIQDAENKDIAATTENEDSANATFDRNVTANGGSDASGDGQLVYTQKSNLHSDGGEKSRLYSKNVLKSDTPSTGPVASLTANTTGSLSQLDAKPPGDQSAESVVMRKKSTPQINIIDENEKESSQITRVRIRLHLLYVGHVSMWPNIWQFRCL